MNRLGNQIIKTASLIGCGIFSYLLYDEGKTMKSKKLEARKDAENFNYSKEEFEKRNSSIDMKAAGLLASLTGLAVGNMLLKNNDNLDTRNTRLEKVSEALLKSNFNSPNINQNNKEKPKEEEKEKNV